MEIGVSIIICTFNGRHRLHQTLEHGICQNTSFPYEILVVNNASTDDTVSYIKSYIAESTSCVPIRIINEVKKGLSFARMRGIEESVFPFILFCDDDNWLNSDFLQIGVEILFRNPEIGVLGSLGIPNFEGAKPSWFDDYNHSYAVGNLGKTSGLQSKGSYHYGAACYFRKEALNKLTSLGFQSLLSDRSGKSLNSGGDVELCLAVQNLGYELHFDDRLKFYHFIESHRLSWDYYIKLKKGIAASFPLLESYDIYKFSSDYEFRMHLWKLYLINIKGILKSGFYMFLAPNKKHDLALATTSKKFYAFMSNYRKTIRSFFRNKQLFNA